MLSSVQRSFAEAITAQQQNNETKPIRAENVTNILRERRKQNESVDYQSVGTRQ